MKTSIKIFLELSVCVAALLVMAIAAILSDILTFGYGCAILVIGLNVIHHADLYFEEEGGRYEL